MIRRPSANRTEGDRTSTRQGCTRRVATMLVGSCVVGLGSIVARAADPLTSSVIARSRVGTGDISRLQRTFAKARRGEPVTLGAIGGSITVGALATKPENGYASRVLEWWRSRFPRSDVRLINAGVGGTGSLYATFRVQKDLLDSEPDVAIVEFAVNDAWTDGEAFEGLVRQILARPNAPAVVLLFMMWEGGGNDQAMQAKVGEHYRLPMVSFRDALWPEMAAGHLQWTDLLADIAHPNDAGHAAAARLVTALLEMADKGGVAEVSDAVDPLPPPLYSDAFQFTDWRNAAALQPSQNEGWNRIVDGKGMPLWVDGQGGGRITFAWFGAGLVAHLVRPHSGPWRVQFWIDDVLSQSIDATTVPNRDIIVVAEGLALRQHSVTIERTDEPGGDQISQALALIALGEIGVKPL